MRRWLTAIVLLHLVSSLVHGVAHREARVPLSYLASLFVFLVVVTGPLIGVALIMRAERVGSWLIAIAMGGSLAFGLVTHFVVVSPDHVAHVDAQWRTLFTTTAALLAVTESLGFGLALRLARKGKLG